MSKKVKKVLTFNVEFVTVVWQCKMSAKNNKKRKLYCEKGKNLKRWIQFDLMRYKIAYLGILYIKKSSEYLANNLQNSK